MEPIHVIKDFCAIHLDNQVRALRVIKTKDSLRPKPYSDDEIHFLLESYSLHAGLQKFDFIDCGYLLLDEARKREAILAPVFVVYYTRLNIAFVYIAGRFAYSVTPTPEFMSDMIAHALLDWRKIKMGAGMGTARYKDAEANENPQPL